MSERLGLAEIMTPTRPAGLAGRLLSSPALPDLAARLAASFAASAGQPWRFGSTVVAVAHAHVREALSRDLDFGIAPVNSLRIRDVDEAFVLGMDRHPVLVHERRALYRALMSVNLEPLARESEGRIAAAIGDKTEIDVVGGFARPVAARTAQLLFGITGPDDEMFCEAVRSIFGHTFLNLSNDPEIRSRAIKAARLVAAWFDAEIRRRRTLTDPGDDMMGGLIRSGELDDDGIRRNLAGMLVGSIDTTATATAKIVTVLARDSKLHQEMAADCEDLELTRGWCFEALRRWPHNPILIRHALRETMLGGTRIAAGDRLFLWTQAAMNDSSAFPEPRLLRPDRPADGYLHFGGSLHCCAGRPVNDWQIPMLVGALLRRGIANVGKIAWAGPFPARLSVSFAP